MMNKFGLIFVLLIVFIVLFVIWFFNDGPPEPKAEGRQTIAGSCRKIPGQRNDAVISQTINSVTKGASAEPGTQSPGLIKYNTQPANQDSISNFSIVVQDSFGQRINSGTVLLDGRQMDFRDGSLMVNTITKGIHSISTQSEGYFPDEKQIEVAGEESVTITLDYKCRYEVTVYEDEANSIPAADADVILYEGTISERPIQNSCIIGKDDNPKNLFQFLRNEDSILYTDQPKNRTDLLNNMTVLSCIGMPGYKGNNDGDHNYVQEFSNEPSSRLARIWDTLCIHARSKSDRFRTNTIEVAGHRKHKNLYIGLPATECTGNAMQTAKTDSNGRCIFIDLKPGLFYIKAHKDGKYSRIYDLMPTLSGINAVLRKDNIVIVDVYSSTDTGGKLPISGASIIMKAKSQSNSSLLMKTTDSTGRAVFPSVSLGEYSIEAAPADSFTFPPKTINLLLVDAFNYISIPIDNCGYEIAGKVLFAVDEKPVKSAMINLMYNGDRMRDAGTVSSGEVAFSHLKAFYLASII